MTEPRHAVDADPGTAWRPGPTGRMVVDLGASHGVRSVRLTWSTATPRPVTVQRSSDGLAWTPVAVPMQSAASMEVPVGAAARYVAVAVSGWAPGDAELIELAVDPA
jgi:hypothetical protein